MGLGYFRWLRVDWRALPRDRAALTLLALFALVLFPARSQAQGMTDTETADARAVLLTPGSMAKVTDIDFGEIITPPVAGTVTVTASATPICSASAGLVRTGNCQSAEFRVRERKNGFVRIRNNSAMPIVLNGPGGATMTMTNVTHSVLDMTPAAAGGGPPQQLGRYRITADSGFASFWIGGRLNVGANQAPGTYTGTFEIQVLFN